MLAEQSSNIPIFVFHVTLLVGVEPWPPPFRPTGEGKQLKSTWVKWDIEMCFPIIWHSDVSIRRWRDPNSCVQADQKLFRTEADWLIAGPYNTIWTTLLNFCRKPSISQVSVALTSEILKIWLNFYLVLFSGNFIFYRRIVNMRITFQTFCRSCKIVVFVWKMMMP